MRAVNLIPRDERTSAAGRSGGVVYVLLGGLAVLVVLVGLWTLAGRDASRSRTELAQLQQRTAQVQRQAAPLVAFQALAAVGRQRIDLVKTVEATRFDWSSTLADLARVLPASVRLQTLKGSLPQAIAAPTPPPAAPGSDPSAKPEKTDTTAAAAPAPVTPPPAPVLQIGGCAPSLAAVAKLVPRMKLVPGVAGVGLGPATVPSPKDDTPATNLCPGATFSLNLTFEPTGPAVASPTASTVAAAAGEETK